MSRNSNRIPLWYYVAVNNPKDTYNILVSEGYNPRSGSLDDVIAMCKDYIKIDKDKALAQIANIHPDKDLILDFNQEDKGVSMNCAGCDSCSCGKNKETYEIGGANSSIKRKVGASTTVNGIAEGEANPNDPSSIPYSTEKTDSKKDKSATDNNSNLIIGTLAIITIAAIVISVNKS